eukprot:1881157-Alexandrium_andersonii.AAC.1
MLAVAEHGWLVLVSGGQLQREHCFISALPAGGRTRLLPRRRELAIFDKGGHRKSEVQLPTIMRSRGGVDEALSLIHI